MENIGALSILLAFCLTVYAVVASVVGRLKKNSFLTVSAERAVYSVAPRAARAAVSSAFIAIR